MKKSTAMIALLVCLLGTGTCFADSSIPNLVGSWTVQAEGGALAKAATPGLKSHHTSEFSTLTAEAVITKQKGRVLYGTFTSPQATETFVAVIGHDNKSLYYADEDGTMDGKIVSKGKIQVVYRHVTASDTVIGVGIWTKKK